MAVRRGKASGRAARGRKPGAGPPPVYEWDRRLGEGPEAYQAFLVYRDLGAQRSLRAARQRWGKGGAPPALSRVEKWSSAWAWTFRVDAWDAHLQRLADERIRQVFTDQIERYRVLSDATLAASSRGLQLVLEGLSKEHAEAPSFSAAIAAAATTVELNQKVTAMAFERLERLQAAGAPATGAREELARRLRQMHEARERARTALEAAQRPTAEVEALKEG